MILDLGPLPYKLAFEVIHYCFEHNIDRAHCLEMIEACSEKPCPPIKWEIDIPDKYVTFFLLKWSGRLSELQIQ